LVDSSFVPHSGLHKCHQMLSYHHVQEAIAAKLLHLIYIPGSLNQADNLSKARGIQQVWDILKAILFWEGHTAELLRMAS